MSNYFIDLTIGGTISKELRDTLIDAINGLVFDMEESIEDLLLNHTHGPLSIEGYIESNDENALTHELMSLKLPFHLHLDNYGDSGTEKADWFWTPDFHHIQFRESNVNVDKEDFIPLLNLLLDIVEHGKEKALPLHVCIPTISEVIKKCVNDIDNTHTILRTAVGKYFPTNIPEIPEIPDAMIL